MSILLRFNYVIRMQSYFKIFKTKQCLIEDPALGLELPLHLWLLFTVVQMQQNEKLKIACSVYVLHE